MSCAAAIVAALNADTTVSGLVTGRIFPVLAPETEPAYPRITYELDQANYIVASDGPTGLASQKVKVYALGLTYSEQAALSNAIRGCLNGKQGTFAGITVQGIFLEDENESQVTDDAGLDSIVHVNEMEFTVWFQPV